MHYLHLVSLPVLNYSPPGALFSPSSKNNKKKSNRKRYLIFSSKKLFWYFGKLNLLIFQEIGLSSPKNKRFQEGTFGARKIKKPTLKKFIFRKVEFCSPKVKNVPIFSHFLQTFLKNFLYFRREFSELEKLKNCSEKISYILLLIVSFHVTNFLYPDSFFAAFFSGTFFLCCCTAGATDLRELFLLSGVFYLTLNSLIFHSTARATDLIDLFLLPGAFYLKLIPKIWHYLLLSRLSWKPAVLP